MSADYFNNPFFGIGYWSDAYFGQAGTASGAISANLTSTSTITATLSVAGTTVNMTANLTSTSDLAARLSAVSPIEYLGGMPTERRRKKRRPIERRFRIPEWEEVVPARDAPEKIYARIKTGNSIIARALASDAIEPHRIAGPQARQNFSRVDWVALAHDPVAREKLTRALYLMFEERRRAREEEDLEILLLA